MHSVSQLRKFRQISARHRCKANRYIKHIHLHHFHSGVTRYSQNRISISKIYYYIPNSIRCYHCQKYTHHIRNAEINWFSPNTHFNVHNTENWSQTILCQNCKSHHTAFSKDSPVLEEEWKFLQIKYSTHKMSASQGYWKKVFFYKK